MGVAISAMDALIRWSCLETELDRFSFHNDDLRAVFAMQKSGVRMLTPNIIREAHCVPQSISLEFIFNNHFHTVICFDFE